MLRFVFACLGALFLMALSALLASMYAQMRLHQRHSEVEKRIVLDALESVGMAEQVEILLTTDGHAIVCSDEMSPTSARKLETALENTFGKHHATRAMSGVVVSEN